MDRESTSPPCNACHSHDSLNDKVDEVKNNNTKEHAEIMKNLDRAVMNIHWIGVIGRWILGSLFVYFLGLGYFIFVNDWATHEDVNRLEKAIHGGDVLHYQNERDIAKLQSDIKYLKDSE